MMKINYRTRANIMLRETLKQEIDRLSENQLRKMSDFVLSLKSQEKQSVKAVPFWQSASPIERGEDLRVWVAQLPETSVSLDDEAFDRGNIYE